MSRLKSNKVFRTLTAGVWLLGMTLAVSLLISTSPALAQEEFKYGALAHVTGPIPQYGEYCIRGSQLALEDLEKSGWINGKKINFFMEDDKNDPKLALAGLRKLIDIDKVPIFETSGSSVVLATGPVAQKNKVVLMNVAAQNPAVRQLGDFIFSLVPLADRVMIATTKFAYEGVGARKAAVMHINNEYGRGVADTFKKLFEEYGGKVLTTEVFPMGETDFTTHLTKIKFANADMVFIVGHENEQGYCYKKAKEMGIKVQWFSPPGYAPLVYEIAGDATVGLKFADYIFSADAGTERMKEFGQRYKKRYGLLPGNAVARTYDSIMIYAAALKNGARTSEQIR
ncbi:MAG: ABC transporter substrate-binding protein, partial [Pseudomonadota bacterium]